MSGKCWKVRWAKMSVDGNSEYVALFSTPHIKTNIIYSYTMLSEAVVKKAKTAIPQDVMREALNVFLQAQPHKKAA